MDCHVWAKHINRRTSHSQLPTKQAKVGSKRGTVTSQERWSWSTSYLGPSRCFEEPLFHVRANLEFRPVWGQWPKATTQWCLDREGVWVEKSEQTVGVSQPRVRQLMRSFGMGSPTAKRTEGLKLRYSRKQSGPGRTQGKGEQGPETG